MCGLCGCTSLLGASLGLIVWCRLVLHLIRGSFLPFLPVTHPSLPLLPSEMAIYAGSVATTGSDECFLGHFGSCGDELTCRLNQARVYRGPREAFQHPAQEVGSVLELTSKSQTRGFEFEKLKCRWTCARELVAVSLLSWCSLGAEHGVSFFLLSSQGDPLYLKRGHREPNWGAKWVLGGL